jgi:hypothetical protein
MNMWTQYEVEMNFLTRLVASVPSDPEIQRKWLESRKPTHQPPNTKSIQEVAEEVADSTLNPIAEERSLLVFQRIEGGIVMRAATVKAHIKDCSSQLSSLYVGRIDKEKSFAVKVKNSVYLSPDIYWLPILRDGKPVASADGIYDKAIHVRNPQGGTINAIKTMEFVEPGCTLAFSLLVLTTKTGTPVVSAEDLNSIFVYGGVHGYAGERGDGEGRYIARIECVK